MKKVDKMEKVEKDEIILEYKVNINKKKIKLFGKYFIKNNKNICKLIYKG